MTNHSNSRSSESATRLGTSSHQTRERGDEVVLAVSGDLLDNDD